MNRRTLLGKVFLSHSWKDKPFVRQLAKRLWREGYQVWLDEKELVPGDQLAARLSEAIDRCRVVIVVVTPASIESNWLKFELNKATERMVNGDCRLIPVLRGKVEVPPELKGLIYADFRKSFARGFDAVAAALEKETQELPLRSWQLLGELIHQVFDSKGYSSGGGEYESFDYEFVEIEGLKDPLQDSQFDASIILDTVHDYLGKLEPLSDFWWNEYLSVHEKYADKYRLIVTERPVGFSIQRANTPSMRVLTRDDKWIDVTIADVSGLTDREEQRTVLLEAKDILRGKGAQRP